jgi:hypothetical protein
VLYPAIYREVMKLAAVAESHATEGYFSRAEKAVILNVWHHLAITRNEMQTDDSFVFSKVRVISPRCGTSWRNGRAKVGRAWG